MKILQIAPGWIDTPPSGYGGTEWVINNLTKGLAEIGQDVTLFATKKSRSAGELKYFFKQSFTQMDLPWTASLPSMLHYHQACKIAQNYDLVHAHLSSGTDLMLLSYLSDLTEQGIPNVLTVHGHWPYDRFSRMDPFYIKQFARNILVINISSSMQKTLPKGFRDGGFVHNSLDASTLKYNPHGGDYLTWLGKIIPDKGLLEAIQVAIATGNQLIFAGVVDKFYDVSVKYFEDKIKPLIDNKQIIYLGPADLKLKNKMLGGAKAFLNPINWEEPFGMVMVEAMACGTPVLSLARGAAPELIITGKTGFLARDIKEMIQAVSLIPSIKRINCRKHIESNFSPTQAAKKYLAIYQKEILHHKTGVLKTIFQDSPAINLKSTSTHFQTRS